MLQMYLLEYSLAITMLLFSVNYLLIDALVKFHQYFGNKVVVPNVGALRNLDLQSFAKVICERLVSLFLPDKNGRRPCHGNIIQ